jgi:hypothetical protein
VNANPYGLPATTGRFRALGVVTLDEGDPLEWAAKLAAANRCSQEVREFAPVPTAGS